MRFRALAIAFAFFLTILPAQDQQAKRAPDVPYVPTPDEVVQKLSDLMVEGGRTERVQKINETFGIDEAARDRAYFKKVIDDEGPVWLDVIRGLNIEPQ